MYSRYTKSCALGVTNPVHYLLHQFRLLVSGDFFNILLCTVTLMSLESLIIHVFPIYNYVNNMHPYCCDEHPQASLGNISLCPDPVRVIILTTQTSTNGKIAAG